MEYVIRHLSPPRHHTYAGIHFMLLKLKRDGVENLVTWLEEAAETLDKEGKLLEYDFDEKDIRLLHQARIGALKDRRVFFRTGAWQVCGAICTVKGLAQIGDRVWSNIAKKATPEKKEGPQEREANANPFKAVDDRIEIHLGPVENLVIGPALIYEGVLETEEIKLEQVSNAVAALAKRLEAKDGPSSQRTPH